jgi:hypothetical protein
MERPLQSTDLYFTLILQSKNITNTPLTPYLDEELLYNNAYSVDGSKIVKAGFNYKHPQVKEETLRETIKGFVSLGYFPADMI